MATHFVRGSKADFAAAYKKKVPNPSSEATRKRQRWERKDEGKGKE